MRMDAYINSDNKHIYFKVMVWESYMALLGLKGLIEETAIVIPHWFYDSHPNYLHLWRSFQFL
jgi:hypothetical protein